ncbi:MAG: hypothetical protein Q8R82_08525 [Hyphomonadaceae bacterium]|nr:hypothetical protein [Hyphomonadaceae bacterium]
MIARGMITKLAAVSMIAMAAAGCASTPAAPAAGVDIDFMRGCWVAKDAPGGTIISFLRLLPPEVGSGMLEGEVRPVASLYADQAVRFSFARDGSAATLDRLVEGQAPDRYVRDASADAQMRAVYVKAGSDSERLVVDGRDEMLRIFTAGRGDENTKSQFVGERDGCD